LGYGSWTPDAPDVDAALTKGDLKFSLNGKKLKGSWVLVRTRGFGRNPSKPSWLLIKHRDAYANEDDITLEQGRSAVSGRTLAEIARDDGGNVARAATGDPK
jgi:bifunctional non-homologous end joining protein LigD